MLPIYILFLSRMSVLWTVSHVPGEADPGTGEGAATGGGAGSLARDGRGQSVGSLL